MEKLKEVSLAVIFLIAIVIKNGMNILGVSLQKKCDDKNSKYIFIFNYYCVYF